MLLDYIVQDFYLCNFVSKVLTTQYVWQCDTTYLLSSDSNLLPDFKKLAWDSHEQPANNLAKFIHHSANNMNEYRCICKEDKSKKVLI